MDEIEMVHVSVEGRSVILRGRDKVTEVVFDDDVKAKEAYEALRKGEYDV